MRGHQGTFPREQALAWDQSMLDYPDRNHFDEVYKGPGDNFFGTLSASRPEIYPIYWSGANAGPSERRNGQCAVIP